MRITAVTCVKNEGPFLIEWIAFNRVIGVTDFLFYSNDCTDATDRLLDALETCGIVTHLPNPAKGRNYQMEALKDAKKQEVVLNSDWVWIADVDEFLNIHVGKGTIPELVEACGDPHAISLTFQFFANCDIETYEDRPVIEQFTRSHNPDIWCDQTAQEVKTLIRHDFPVKYYGAHRPFMRENLPKASRPVWTDGSGRDVPWKYRVAANKRRIRKFPAGGAREFATLNHYALRSLDSYLVKNDRGDVNREHRSFDDTYWRERNDDAWEDLSIHRYLPRLKAEMDRLLADDEIRALHDAAVAAHRDTLDRLMKEKDYRALREGLRSCPKISPAELALRELIET
ncbi:glycosyltransferase family 2 protein [Aliiroseovarius sp. KMU-50]|uniref:Glycosyltransferase family 2 protein n=1 Tax=Aliiroseovarius salicola TaxID=3009082 RepID=A0ABT4W058_9RHOB|nr:glycosyltransferase family 2 protein [Aliiroseovarius sp. KMU-50]MDA5093900.1 glycosyltransferase family 2 protein [Aliiroseovarius sp. KMU-50]